MWTNLRLGGYDININVLKFNLKKYTKKALLLLLWLQCNDMQFVKMQKNYADWSAEKVK